MKERVLVLSLSCEQGKKKYSATKGLARKRLLYRKSKATNQVTSKGIYQWILLTLFRKVSGVRDGPDRFL